MNRGLQQQALKTAKYAVQQYGLKDVRFGLLRRVKTKQIFCVSSAQGNFVLRIHDPSPTRNEKVIGEHVGAELRSQEAVCSQMRWLSDLRRDIRLPVPEPILTLDGSLAGSVSFEDMPSSRSFALLRWIPGRHKDELTPLDAYSLGSYIATLHCYAERYSVPEGFVRPRWDFDNLLGGSAPQWSRLGEIVFSKCEMETLTSTAERIRQTLHAIGESCDTFGIIHRDLHLRNFVFHKEVMYAIDFDQCGWGYYLYDLVMIYRFLGAHYEKRFAAMQGAFLEGYQLVRLLPDLHLESLEAFMSLRLMARMHEILTNLGDVPLNKVAEQRNWKLLWSLVRRLEELS